MLILHLMHRTYSSAEGCLDKSCWRARQHVDLRPEVRGGDEGVERSEQQQRDVRDSKRTAGSQL